jgi:hypothetical protein
MGESLTKIMRNLQPFIRNNNTIATLLKITMCSVTCARVKRKTMVAKTFSFRVNIVVFAKTVSKSLELAHLAAMQNPVWTVGTGATTVLFVSK